MMGFILAWFIGGFTFIFFWALWAEVCRDPDRSKVPDQWRKYRGVMNLPARKGEPPPLDTARLIQVMRRAKARKDVNRPGGSPE